MKMKGAVGSKMPTPSTANGTIKRPWRHYAVILATSLLLFCATMGEEVVAIYGQIQKIKPPKPKQRFQSFGESVAMSKDGTVAAVGAPFLTSKGVPYSLGGFYVYTRQSTKPFMWKLSSGRLLGNNYFGASVNQGYALALSGNGDYLAASAPYDHYMNGTVWIFRRKENTWSQQAMLSEADTGPGPLEERFGLQLAISASGDTLVAARGTSNCGFTVFVRQNNSWVQQGQTVVLYSGSFYNPTPSGSVALTDDGNTLFYALRYFLDTDGGVWVYKRNPAKTWIQVAGKIKSSIASCPLSASVTATADGSHFAVGSNNCGAMIFVKQPDGTYTYAQKVSADYTLDYSHVVMSSDGNRIFIGVPSRPLNPSNYQQVIGSYLSFAKTNVTSWTQMGSYIYGTYKFSGHPEILIGNSLAMDAYGENVIMGGPKDDYKGAVWFFKDDATSTWRPTSTYRPTRLPTPKPSKTPTRLPTTKKPTNIRMTITSKPTPKRRHL